ncbi:AAA family ATPase [Nocardiopsis coralliicola]
MALGTQFSGPGSGRAPGDPVLKQAHGIGRAIESVVEGKPEAVRMVLTVLLAEGHLLIEDVPGVGKTLIAKALGRAVGGAVQRIQFTPDLLPGDITGVTVYRQESGAFEFVPGPVFANVVLGDEINRASPKTQSALLECMEEMQVSVDGSARPLERPFMVVATQNPGDMEGTYPLPEAQRDRFMARISVGYPSPQAELDMIDLHSAASPLERIAPAAGVSDVRAMAEHVRSVHVAPGVRRYAVDLVAATRTAPALRLGASPRATLHLVRAARAYAALEGRNYVIPDDLQALAVPVLAHRLVPSPEARMEQHGTDRIVADLVARLPVPAPR